jgi:long-chain acyl-CoA synthetase
VHAVRQPATSIWGAEVTEAELIDYTHDRLAAYKRPRQVVFLSSLPATSTGKIMRRKLADARPAPT